VHLNRAQLSCCQEGLDVKLALHYFSRVAFVEALGQALDANKGKVLLVLSAGVHSAYTEDDFELKDNYSLMNAANAAVSVVRC
jgi:hypothetical protein